MSPRLPVSGGEEISVFPRGRDPRPLAWLVIAFTIVPALIALVSDEPGTRLILGALAVTVLVIGISTLVMFGAIGSRVVRVHDAPGALRFVPSRAATVPMYAIGLALLLPGAARLTADASGMRLVQTSLLVTVAPYVLGALGLVVLVLRLVRLRVPAGLTLTSKGLRGIRGQGELDWRWEDLARVGVVAAPAAKLSLLRVGSARPILAPPLALGSDPNLVAALVQFYLDHPSRRVMLDAGGPDAVRHAEQASRP